MADLECHRVTADGVTLVGAVVRTDVPERVALEPTHAGPLWPPRRRGVPEAGWADGRWTGVVEPDEVHALGYATPAETDDPPVRIVDAEPAGADDTPVTPEAVVRALGDHAPARDAVAPPAVDRRGTDVADEVSPESRRTNPEASPTETGDAYPAADGVDVAAIERRVARAETLAAASEGRTAVDGAAARELATALESDRETLRELSRRLQRAADRVDRAAAARPG